MRRALTSLVLALGCGAGDVKLTRFEAFDPQALNAEFTDPTGVLNAESAALLFGEDLDDTLKFAAKGVGGMVRKVMDDGDSDGTKGSLEAALTVTSSNAYLRLSCPGPDLELPDLDFGHGELRLDAPGIMPSKAAIKDGDVLLTFLGCQSGNMLIQAKNSAYYDVTKGFIFELDLSASTVSGRSVGRDAMKFRVGLKGQVELLVETAEGTFVVDVGGLPGSLSVRGSNTTVDCTLSGSKATCDLGGKKVTFDTRAARNNG